MKKFEVLQYLSQKRPEPDPKLLELQDQMSTWMNFNMNPNTRVSEIHSCLNCVETLFSMIKNQTKWNLLHMHCNYFCKYSRRKK